MINATKIWKSVVDLKNAYLVIITLAGAVIGFGDWTVNYIAQEVVERTGQQQYQIYKVQRAHDSIRFEMAADLAAQVLARQDSITFVMASISQWQKHIDRRIGQMAKKISEDTVQSVHQRELIEIRRLLQSKESAEKARIETEEAMRKFINDSLRKINRIKKGDRAQ